MTVERWVFTAEELAVLDGGGRVVPTPYALDEFRATVPEEVSEEDVIVYRNGTVSNHYGDGTAGLPREVVEAAEAEEEYVSLDCTQIADTWRDVVPDEFDNFLRFATEDEVKAMGAWTPEVECLLRLDGSTEEVEVDDHPAFLLPMLRIGQREYYVARDHEEAGSAARRSYEQEDESELRALIGDEVLIQWGLGDWAGPGSNSYRSLAEWLESTEDYPEEVFASYDGEERDAEISKAAADELGWNCDGDWLPVVVYRNN